MLTNYDLIADDIWDVWEASVLEHSFNVFSVLRKACSSDCLSFFVVILQLTSDVGVRTLKSYFVLERVPKLAQLEKDSCFTYEDLMKRKELTRAELACQKARYSSQRGLQAV